jgi:hypothetical protein
MMHVSWTTLREQIFAKLRRPYRSEANMNEVGHGKREEVFCFLHPLFEFDVGRWRKMNCHFSLLIRVCKNFKNEPGDLY